MAAVVSDNDGSAFVSKSEFDILKKDFQSQIEKYNTSIDNKIDGAIASYLAGIQMSVEETLDVPYSDFGEVVCMNYHPASTYYALSFVGSYVRNSYAIQSGDSRGLQQCMWHNCKITSNRNSSNYQQVNVVDAGNQSATEPTNVVWIGRSKNYWDSLQVTLTYKDYDSRTQSDGNGYWVSNPGSVYSHLCYYARIAPGYYATLPTSGGNIWTPRVYMRNTSVSAATMYVNNGSLQSGTAGTEVQLREVSGKKFDYEHIIHWNNIESLRVCDPDWLYSLRASGSVRRDAMTSASTSGTWSILERQSNQYRANVGYSTSYKSSYGSNSDSNSLPTVGMLNSSYTSKTIKQTDRQYKQIIGSNTYTANNSTSDSAALLDGFQLFAANKGDVITWIPVFKNSKKGTAADSGPIKLYLAVGPLGATTSLKDSNSVRITDASNNDSSYFLIKNLKQKISFEMPKDGIVYAKWCHETSPSGNWEISLDLTNCSTYKRKIAD